jgi:hypothetical protein
VHCTLVMKNLRLKTLLVDRALCTPRQLEDAIARTQGAGCTWIEDLIMNGIVDDEKMCAVVAEAAWVQRCDPEALVAVPRGVLACLPADVAFEHRVVPIGIDAEGDLHVVMLDPCDTTAIEETTFFANRPVTREAGTATAIAWALHQHYGVSSALWPRAQQQLALVA